LVRSQSRRKEEKERIDRLRRIRKQEKELLILRRIPVADYITMEKLKQDNNAKTIQRMYQKHLVKTKRGHLVKNRRYIEGGRIRGGIYAGGLVEIKKKAARDMKKEDFWSEKSAATILAEKKAAKHADVLLERVKASVTEQSARQLTDTAHKIEVDALGLAQLQRRIKDETRRKSKLRAREKENSFGYRGGKDQGIDPYPLKRGLFDGPSNPGASNQPDEGRYGAGEDKEVYTYTYKYIYIYIWL
jgi:hypothetical protein